MVETTDNAFLGGQLQLLQPARGYRAGIDPVLLAAACEPRRAGRVLELGCGVGTALFCLAKRVPGLTLTGVELHPEHAKLARENAARNGLDARIFEADIAALPTELRRESFDLILANPPFFDRAASSPSENVSREAGRGEDVALSVWMDVARKRLAPKGQMVFISRVERLPDMLSSAEGLGSLEVIPLQPREGRAARLVLLRARKTGRAAFKLHPPIVLHSGASHTKDGDDYTSEVSSVLRQGVALSVR